jgi:glycosyltransferase involved in cell wall biosynthesis
VAPKIAILTNYPADQKTFTGGVETATAGLLDGLCAYQNEFEFHVVSFSAFNAKDIREQKEGFFFHFLGIPHYRWLRPRFPFRLVKAYRELRRINPDLIHCQDNMALALASILSGYPRVFTVHGVKRHEAPKRTGWEFWSASMDSIIERYVHRHFDAFICISNYARRVIGDGYLTFDVPNPVRSLFFQRPTNSPTPQNPYFLFVGALAPLKRPTDLLLGHAELRHQFPNLETIFCGETEDASYVRTMHKIIEEKGIGGVFFLRHVSQEKLVELLKGAIALVLPSSQENSPMTIAEAMATGVPVVATRVGGVPEIVEDGKTGFLYKVGEANEMIAFLKRLLTSPELAREMGNRGREKALSIFHPTKVGHQTIQAYRVLLAHVHE